MAQLRKNPDSLRANVAARKPERAEVVGLLLYNRVILDAKGNVRFDQNVVLTVQLNDLFKLQVGFRIGERPHDFSS